MNIIETAWLAGLLEGEGCFYMHRGAGGTPKVVLSMTDEDTVARAALLMDASYRIKARLTTSGKTVWVTELHGERALRLMRAVLPYMGKRRSEKIHEVMLIADQRPKVAFGERHGIARFSNEEVMLIRAEYESGPKSKAQSRLARKYGVPVRTMHGVLTGKTYSRIQ